jgi:hypothetical protein
MLDVTASAAVRDQLDAELEGIGSAEEAATWAHRVLGAKGSLTAADAKEIESAFQVKLATFNSAADTNLDTRPKNPRSPRSLGAGRGLVVTIPKASIKANSLTPSRVGFATATMSGLSPSRPA